MISGKRVRPPAPAIGIAPTSTPRASADNLHSFEYDDQGRLTADRDPQTPEPEAAFKSLARTKNANGWEVEVKTATGVVTNHKIETVSDAVTLEPVERSTTTHPDGTTTVIESYPSGKVKTASSDGATVVQTPGIDPLPATNVRFPKEVVTTLSPGLSRTESRIRTWSPPTSGGADAGADASPDADAGAGPNAWATRQDELTVSGKTWTTTLDHNARTITLKTPKARESVTTLDEKGRIARIAAPGTAPVNIQYDAVTGRPSLIEQGDAERKRSTIYGYQTPWTVTNALGEIITLGRDELSRVSSMTKDGRVAGLGFDGNGNLSVVTPPGKAAHSQNFNGVDLLESYVAPAAVDGGAAYTTCYGYDDDRRLTSVTHPDPGEVKLEWDKKVDGTPLGRLKKIYVVSPSWEISRSYDSGSGLLKTMSGPGTQTVTYGYTGGRRSSISWGNVVVGGVSWTYRNGDLYLDTETAAGVPITYGYDDDGLVTTAGALTLYRNPTSGRIHTATLAGAGGLGSDFQYDEFGALRSYAESRNLDSKTLYDVIYDSVEYPRDKLGRVKRKVETVLGAEGAPVIHTHDYAYDSLGRLKQVTIDSVAGPLITYDDNGNRLDCEADGQDRLKTCGTVQYTPDARGRITSKLDATGTTLYTYDPMGNLTGATLPPASKQVTYLLDGEGRRVGRKVDNVLKEQYLYLDRYRIAAVLDGAGNLKWRFVYATGRHVPEYAIDGTGVAYRVVTDQLGSLRLVVRASDGAIVQRMNHDAWGVADGEWTAAGVYPVPIGFAGGLYDPDTKLVHFGAREYDPVRGRWTSKDPISFRAGDPNLYSYVGNTPVNLVDVTGLVVKRCFRSSVFFPMFSHEWLKTSSSEAGMGPDEPIWLLQTVIENHSGTPAYSELDGSYCIETDEDVDEQCVDDQLDLGASLGTFGPLNNCQTFAEEVLRRCRRNDSDFVPPPRLGAGSL